MRIDERSKMGALAIAGAVVVASSGCGGATAVSPQLVGARAVMQEAHAGSAAQLEPDELLVAERALEAAEREPDGSLTEMHFAYMSEREARTAMANARRRSIEEGIAHTETEYEAELRRLARERGVALQSSERTLRERELMIEQQEAALRDREAALAAEQQARRDAEANAAAAMDRVAELASVRQQETVITFNGEVLFETASATLRPDARSRLAAVAAVLRATPAQSATIAGYTDSRGSNSYNQQLSQQRADTVRDFLLGEGVPMDRLRSEGRGETMPIASNASAEGRANNRRVEIIIHPSAMTTTPQQAPQVTPHTAPRHIAPHVAPPTTQPPSTPPPPVMP